MNLSAVIVNWNSGRFLARLLGSMADWMDEFRQVVVVDNDSHDGSLEAVSRHPGVRLLAAGRNLGFAGAANRGIAGVDSPLVLLANPDVELNRASVRRLCEKMLPLERTAIACGPLMGEDGTPQTAFQLRPLPTWRGVLRDVLFIDELAAWLRPSGGVSQGRPSEAPAELEGVEVEQPAAAFWLLRTAAWRDVGGFDEAFHPAWFEDVDFCRRLRSVGWAIRYFADCPVLHRGGLSLETLSHREFVASYYGNLLKYLKKHHARAYPWLWLPVKAGTWARLCGIRRR